MPKSPRVPLRRKLTLRRRGTDLVTGSTARLVQLGVVPLAVDVVVLDAVGQVHQQLKDRNVWGPRSSRPGH